MKAFWIIAGISVVSFIAYLAIRDYKLMLFKKNMSSGQKCSFYLDNQRLEGVIRFIDECGGKVGIYTKDITLYLVSKEDVYPPYHPVFFFEK